MVPVSGEACATVVSWAKSMTTSSSSSRGGKAVGKARDLLYTTR